MLGKGKWIRTHPLKTEDDYRKVRYPLNFTSGSYLFGYDDCVKGCEMLIVCEGPREVMKLWQEGYTNAVAVLGAHLSGEQEKLICSLGPKKVVLMFDGDDAGVATTTRVGKKLATIFPNQRLKKVFVPRGRDPKNLERADFDRLINE
jgi:DNA primase